MRTFEPDLRYSEVSIPAKIKLQPLPSHLIVAVVLCFFFSFVHNEWCNVDLGVTKEAHPSRKGIYIYILKDHRFRLFGHNRKNRSERIVTRMNSKRNPTVPTFRGILLPRQFSLTLAYIFSPAFFAFRTPQNKAGLGILTTYLCLSNKSSRTFRLPDKPIRLDRHSYPEKNSRIFRRCPSDIIERQPEAVGKHLYHSW